MPPTVERRVGDRDGALQLVYPDAVSESPHRAPRDARQAVRALSNRRSSSMRAFDALLANAGRSRDNLLFRPSSPTCSCRRPPARVHGVAGVAGRPEAARARPRAPRGARGARRTAHRSGARRVAQPRRAARAARAARRAARSRAQGGGGAGERGRTIRAVRANDAPRICEIYNGYVRDTVITFEEQPVADPEMAQTHRGRDGDAPMARGRRRRRCSRAMRTRRRGRRARRIGSRRKPPSTWRPSSSGAESAPRSIDALLDELRRARTALAPIGGIALPNPRAWRCTRSSASGRSAQFEEVGWKFGRWIDVGYWELAL